MNGLEIKKARIQKGYSQEYLGKLIGSSKRTIINYEKGEIIPETKSEILRRVLSTGEGEFLKHRQSDPIHHKIKKLELENAEMKNKIDFVYNISKK